MLKKPCNGKKVLARIIIVGGVDPALWISIIRFINGKMYVSVYPMIYAAARVLISFIIWMVPLDGRDRRAASGPRVLFLSLLVRNDGNKNLPFVAEFEEEGCWESLSTLEVLFIPVTNFFKDSYLFTGESCRLFRLGPIFFTGDCGSSTYMVKN